jgi:CRISPR system Cascade subunit CasB
MIEEAKQAGAFVEHKIEKLRGSKNESTVKATLACLRRGIGKAPGSIPELWDATLNGLPEALLSNGDTPSRGEWAVHTALTLYALHQQGKDMKEQNMNKKGESLGIAVRKLIGPEKDNEESVTRRLNAAATSDSFEEFAQHLRELIELLKSKGVPFDYPKLAEDLYLFQFPDMRDSIRLKLGQDFYRGQYNEKQDSNVQ